MLISPGSPLPSPNYAPLYTPLINVLFHAFVRAGLGGFLVSRSGTKSLKELLVSNLVFYVYV